MAVQSRSDAVGEDPPTWRTMTVLTKTGTVVTWVVFVLYLVFLFKLLLFSRAPGSERSVNLVPFATISDYLSSSSAGVRRFAIGNVLGNVVVFVPLGAFLPLLRRRIGTRTNLLVVIGTSVAVEIVQGVFGLGAADIDDVILNTLGGLVGIVFLTLLRVLLQRWSRLVASMAVLSLMAVPVLLYLLFAITLRM